MVISTSGELLGIIDTGTELATIKSEGTTGTSFYCHTKLFMQGQSEGKRNGSLRFFNGSSLKFKF